MKILDWVRKLISAYWKGAQKSGGGLNTARNSEQLLREFRQPSDVPVKRDDGSYDL